MYIWEFQIVWTYVYLFCTPDRESKGELLHRFPRFFNDFWCNECYVTTSFLYIFLHGEKRCYFWCFKYFITILFPLTLTGVRRFRRYCRHNAQFSFIIIFIKLFVVFLNEIHDSTDNCRFTRRLVTRWRYVPNVAVCFAFLLLIHTTTVNTDTVKPTHWHWHTTLLSGSTAERHHGVTCDLPMCHLRRAVGFLKPPNDLKTVYTNCLKWTKKEFIHVVHWSGVFHLLTA